MRLTIRPRRAFDPDLRQKPSKTAGVGDLIKLIVQALVIAVVVRSVLFQPFNIPSGSLIPTLYVGDYIMVSKFSYGWSRYSVPWVSDYLPKGRIWAGDGPKRGEVAVFKLPSDDSTDLIKRVIGLPGDRIQMLKGRLYINGELVAREPAKPLVMKNAFGRDVEVPTYTETLPGGTRHAIIEVEGDNGEFDNTPEYLVPPDHYFMMGDNRDNSEDSRVIGSIPLENFVGKAQIIFFSVGAGPNDTTASVFKFWDWPSSVRVERLIKFIH